MLLYTSNGKREYDRRPVLPMGRRGWEFQAVLAGQIATLLPNGPPPLRARTLWVFPPGSVHGWTGAPGEAAEVAVFHFVGALPPVRQLCAGMSVLELPLTTGQARRVRALAQLAARYWNRPQLGLLVCYQQILCELSLMVCEGAPQLDLPVAVDRSRATVMRAMQWYVGHLAENPGQEAVARAAGVSVAHLRRLFHRVFGRAPKAMLDQVRFEQALHLLADQDLKLAAIAAACGFGSASAFSRAFKTAFGSNPG
ncbi:MAG: AraC family transcriptional regulator, partial [Candidatus Marinimicrobia bacterium]|nr:AraC family transcriptional regulator [Candidatus Neomarinimicrobiota bacterium]